MSSFCDFLKLPVVFSLQFSLFQHKQPFVFSDVLHKLIAYLYPNTVGPRLFGHQLSGYLYYPAAILQCILSILHSFPHTNFAQNKNKVDKYLFYIITCTNATELAVFEHISHIRTNHLSE